MLRGVTDEQAVMCLDFHASLVAGGSNDKVARVWDIGTERVRVSARQGESWSSCRVLHSL